MLELGSPRTLAWPVLYDINTIMTTRIFTQSGSQRFPQGSPVHANASDAVPVDQRESLPREVVNPASQLTGYAVFISSR